jgi:ferredoxin
LEFTKYEVLGSETEFELGTPVSIRVIQKNGSEMVLNAKVGDNLRQTLIDNGFEVYQGLKQKLGNCGGAGQCTFCAVDFVESQGWAERSDYENQKLKKFPAARLACLNNIQGPATIKKTER